MDIKKEYLDFLKDINKKDTKQTKQYFKNLVSKLYIEFYGISSEKTKQVLKQLEEF